MKQRVFVTAIALVVAFLMSGTLAHAQTASAEIGFPFVAAGKAMPAGKYNAEVVLQNFQVQLTGPDGTRVILPVITLLGRHDKDPDAEFVFDKLDGKAVLSEVWIPGQDGALLLATKGAHSHAVVGGSNPRK
jgi:hypothetical protein